MRVVCLGARGGADDFAGVRGPFQIIDTPSPAAAQSSSDPIAVLFLSGVVVRKGSPSLPFPPTLSPHPAYRGRVRQMPLTNAAARLARMRTFSAPGDAHTTCPDAVSGNCLAVSLIISLARDCVMSPEGRDGLSERMVVITMRGHPKRPGLVRAAGVTAHAPRKQG